MQRRVTMLFVMTVLGACQPEGSSGGVSRVQDLVLGNGMQLNGMQLNGMQLNGMQLNGVQSSAPLNGLALDGRQVNQRQLLGAELQGAPLTSLRRSGSLLAADRNGDPAQPVSGTALIGATLTVRIEQTEHTFQLQNIYQDAQSAVGDVYLYDIVFRTATTGWLSLCTDSQGSAVPAVLLPNSWDLSSGARIDDPGTVTFACVNGALGKCVRLGYRPWASAQQCTSGSCTTVPLLEHHQACSRMIRADYCGTGQSYTINGTLIDVWDGLSPALQSRATDWPLEANWAPGGATCLSVQRKLEDVKRQYPDCNGNGKRDDFPPCIGSYAVPPSALLANSFQP